MRYLIIAWVLLSLSGCTTAIKLSKVDKEKRGKVTLQDMRSSEEKLYRRDGVLEPIQYFGDKDFSSSPLVQLSDMLATKLPSGEYSLKALKFRVIDIFPQRMNGAISGAVTGALSSMGYISYVHDSGGLTQDNITCLFGGNFQEKALNVSVSVPYKLSPFAGAVKGDEAFIRATSQCLDILSEKIASSL